MIQMLSRCSLFTLVASFWLCTAQAATVHVADGGDLQLALTNARPGDIVELAAGATFTGNFTLPAKDGGTAVIVLRSAIAADAVAGRVTPDQAAAFAKIRTPNTQPAIQTSPGTHHWRLELLEVFGSGMTDLIALGDGSSAQRTPASVPHDLVIDRCYIHGDATAGIKRCVALNSASTTISNSYIADCKASGQDAQAIAGWNGPGPFTIENNYLEGAGENVLFGGADPSIPNLVPADIIVRNNLITKPTAWRQSKWQIKNLLELKNARRVTIERNTLEHNWEAAQSGFAVLFTVRNQDGRCPWCQVEQVMFSSNMLRQVGAGISILGYDDSQPSQQTRSLVIRDNLFTEINPKLWGGNGYAFLLLGGPRDVTIDHNTFIQENASGLVQVEGPPILGFVFTNNIGQQGAYGFIGADHAPGNDTFRTFFPAALVANNVIAGADPHQYPPGNLFPSASEFRSQFVSFDNGNYQLTATSAWRKAGTDGLDLGRAAIAFQRDTDGDRRAPGSDGGLRSIEPGGSAPRSSAAHSKPPTRRTRASSPTPPTSRGISRRRHPRSIRWSTPTRCSGTSTACASSTSAADRERTACCWRGVARRSSASTFPNR